MADPRRRTRRGAALAAAVATAVLAAGCGGAASGGDAAFEGRVLDNPYQVDPTPLTDTEGEPFSLTSDTDARLSLVFFGYTNCPDICQIVMSTLASAMQQLDEADRSQVDVVYVTTDPARDDEATLRTYLDRLDPDFIGLTGDLSTIEEVGQSMAVGITKGDRLPSGGYDVSHSTQVLGIDVTDTAPVYWSQETTAREYAADIHTLLND